MRKLLPVLAKFWARVCGVDQPVSWIDRLWK
mgnify:CR=1 FL=1|jgi:hypothetical protein